MHITVAGCKRRVGRSTTAIHLACYLSTHGRVVLVDGNPNRTTLIWSQQGPHLPFDVIDVDADVDLATYDHSVFDLQVYPTHETLKALAKPNHYLLLVTTPDLASIEALKPTLQAFKDLGATHYRVLLTHCSPQSLDVEAKAREALQEFPLFRHTIQSHVAYERSAMLGVPVYVARSFDHHAMAAWSDYEQVGEELFGQHWNKSLHK